MLDWIMSKSFSYSSSEKENKALAYFFLLFNNKIRSVHLVSPCLIAVKILLMSADSELLERKNRTKQNKNPTTLSFHLFFLLLALCDVKESRS